MENKNDNVEIKDEDIKEDDFSEDELADDATDWKAKALELKGIAKRRATQLAKAKEKLASNPEKKPDAPEPKEITPKKSDEFDDGQLAYLSTKGIESDEDLEFTKGELKKSGVTLRELMSNEYFQSKVKTRKDATAALEATPNSKRSRGGADDTVEFHYAKYQSTGKLPADREMANKIIDLRVKKETSDSEFNN